MNKKLLRSVMVEHGDTQATLADALGISLQALNSKINERGREFWQTEIDLIRKRYQLTPEQVTAIFFSTVVS